MLMCSVTGNATHIRAGEITVERINCQGLKFRFTILGYRDTGSQENIQFGGGIFDFGDGSEPEFIPEDFVKVYLGNEIERNIYIIEHTYSAAGTYIISYLEQNRNGGIFNMDNSVTTPFYIESKIIIDPYYGCNNSPQLLIPPIDEGCTQVAFYHNAGAFDPDGDSLSYEFVIPKQDRGVDVANYKYPNDNSDLFYPNGFGTGNEAGQGRPTFSINPITGDVVWDAPGAAGEFNLAFKIIEWRQIDGVWVEMGYVTRDMQVIIYDCDNERPTLDIPEDICVEAGTMINEIIIGQDPDGDDVKIEAFSQIFDFISSPPVIDPDPEFNDYVPVEASTQFIWNTDCFHVREEPYQIVFKITDNPPLGPQLVTFATWNITIVGPAPDFNSVARNGRSADLTWDKYVCANKNAEKIQIWRRVDSFDYTPDECETGIRENSGYELIDELAADATNYNDDDHGKKLAWGAKYCYRLVVNFPNPLGGESIVSREICIDPVLATAPVITNVTVDTTSETEGEITVNWLPPFDLDLTAFDLPLHYEIKRSVGFNGTADQITLPTTQETTLLDQGLNTSDEVYNYQVTVFDNFGTEIATSVSASSVRLEPAPQFRKIELTWTADVPWSNNTQGYTHEIYRDNMIDSDPSRIEFYDMAIVNETGFAYIDSGQVKNEILEDTKLYCYYVKTYGSYGNPVINGVLNDIPQINFSQIICAQPNDTIPPCKPELFIDELLCRELGDVSEGSSYFFDNVSCEFNNYENNLNWTISDECGTDVREFELWYLPTLGSRDSVLVDKVSNLDYVHSNLSSFKGCYVVRAVDRSGNKSEFSEMVCKDNCPRYVLPNIFTPNESGTNDKFYAFSNLSKTDVDNKDCPRFVNSVEFTVYNRWGKLVYEYNSQDAVQGGEAVPLQEAILIGWDGKTNNGEELSTGVYYYSAKVKFDLLDPSNDVKIIKGWVQLMR